MPTLLRSEDQGQNRGTHYCKVDVPHKMKSECGLQDLGEPCLNQGYRYSMNSVAGKDPDRSA